MFPKKHTGLVVVVGFLVTAKIITGFSLLTLGLWPWQVIWLLGLQFYLVSQGKEPAVRLVSDETNRFIVVVSLFFIGAGIIYLLDLARRKWGEDYVSMPPIMKAVILTLGLLAAIFSPAQAANQRTPIDCLQEAVDLLASFTAGATHGPYYTRYPSVGETFLIPPPGHFFHHDFLDSLKHYGSKATNLSDAEKLLAQAGYRPKGETAKGWKVWVRPHGWKMEDGCDDSPPPPPAPAGSGQVMGWLQEPGSLLSRHLLTVMALIASMIGITGWILIWRRIVVPTA